MRHRHRVAILIFAITTLFTTFAVPAHAGPAGTLLSKINSVRASSGLAPLETYWDLTDDARAQTNRMIDKQQVYHSSNLAGVTGVWQSLGENVGVGVDASQLHDAFMASSGHRANILGDFNYVGIGAKVDENGFLWATVIFMRAAPGLNDPVEEQVTTTTIATTTTTTAASTPDPVPVTTTTTAAPAPAEEAPVVTTYPTKASSTNAETERAKREPTPVYGHPDAGPGVVD